MQAHKNSPNWIAINEFGDSKIYVDDASIAQEGSRQSVLTKYVLIPYGTDRRNGRAVTEMLMHEEYDLNTSCFRIHKIVFTYDNGEVGDPLLTEPTWHPADGGMEKALAHLRRRSS